MGIFMEIPGNEIISMYLKFFVFNTCPDAFLFASSSFFFSTFPKVGYFLNQQKKKKKA